MQEAFLASALYQPPIVLGRQLRHFSPFHALALEAVNSPFAHDPVTGVTPDSLIVAIHTCSLSYADGLAALLDTAAIQKWGASVGKWDFDATLKIFKRHISDSMVLPAFYHTGDEEDARAPVAWHLATSGMRFLNMTEADAWDCSIAKLVCYRACISEWNGSKSLKSDEEIKGRKILEEIKAREEAVKDRNSL
jgi:hypothetical protein